MEICRHNFKKWLESKGPYEIVGKFCPIQGYLEARTGNRWRVGMITYMQTNSAGNGIGPCLNLPSWAQDYMYPICKWASFRIQARTALKILGRGY